MKKELFAGVLLLVLIGLCAWNLRYLSRMCTQLDEAVAQAEASCAAGDPARASETLRAASARWSEAEDYAHCMLPHESTDAVTEGFRRAIRTAETGDPSAAVMPATRLPQSVSTSSRISGLMMNTTLSKPARRAS